MFDPIAQQILQYIGGWTSISGTLIQWVTSLIALGMSIVVMWHGFNVVRGAGGNNHLLDVFAKSIRALLVLGLALAGGAYSTNVVGFAQELRTELSNLFIEAPIGSSSYALLDAGIEKAITTMREGMPWVAEHTSVLSGDFTGLIALAAMALMVGSLVAYGFVATVNLLLVDFSLALIFALGPLFVACLAFEALTKFFDSWLAGVLKYTFTAIVIAAIVGVGNDIVLGYCDQIQAAGFERLDFIGTTFGALGAGGVLILLAVRAPELAGNFVGGIAVSALGLSAASGPMAAASGASRAVANAAAVGAGKVRNTTAVSNAIASVAATPAARRTGAALYAMGRFTSATTNMEKGSVGAAYRSAAGGGTGVITGGRGGRPPGRPVQAE